MVDLRTRHATRHETRSLLTRRQDRWQF